MCQACFVTQSPGSPNALSPAQPGFFSLCVSLSLSLSDETPEAAFRLLADLCSSVPGGFWRMLGRSEEQEKAPLASVLMCSASLVWRKAGHGDLTTVRLGGGWLLRWVKDCTHYLPEGPCLTLGAFVR